MRIAEIATLSRSTPPDGEGSVEALVSALTETLVQRGHEVTLYATADSRTRATLRSPVATSYSRDPSKWNWQVYEAYQAREAFLAWRDFDVIHCHSYHFGLLYCDFVPIPSLHSIHIEPGPDIQFMAGRTRNRRLHFASRWQARDFQSCPGTHVIPHGVQVGQFHVRPLNQRENYLAYLGRFIPEKGAMEAIELARKIGMPLKLAGPRNEYFVQAIQPRLCPGMVEYVGEVRGAGKAEFLSQARALAYPVTRGEPFGLALTEAMASGLPVLAFGNGAVPEIVKHGVTGWIGETVDDLAEGAKRLDSMDPEAIRRHVERNYSHTAMVDAIEKALSESLQDREGA